MLLQILNVIVDDKAIMITPNMHINNTCMFQLLSTVHCYTSCRCTLYVVCVIDTMYMLIFALLSAYSTVRCVHLELMLI